METNIATIKRGEQQSHLVLDLSGKKYEIILTEDNPIIIKSVFNNLLRELKKGLFEFALQDDKKDLFHEICKEYITQLNAELKSVYNELTDYDLLEKS